MMDMLANIALIATAVAFAVGFMLTSTSGSAKPVKIFLGIATAVLAIALVVGLIISRGLLIYLTFQIIALIMLWYLMVILGAVCGGGMYVWMNRKPPGTNLQSADMSEYLRASEFSALEQITEERAISRIKSGYYQGGLLQGAWYIHRSELSQNKNHKEAT